MTQLKRWQKWEKSALALLNTIGSKDDDETLDLIYYQLNRWMEDGLTYQLEDLFERADPDVLTLDMSVGLLSASLPYADKITTRPGFIAKLKVAKPDDIEKILKGLE